jgi:hypothetical protein
MKTLPPSSGNGSHISSKNAAGAIESPVDAFPTLSEQEKTGSLLLRREGEWIERWCILKHFCLLIFADKSVRRF